MNTSIPLADLNLGEARPGWSQTRLARVRAEVQAGTYGAPAELVAEALLASSLLGLAPGRLAQTWAFATPEPPVAPGAMMAEDVHPRALGR